ncbi:WD40-repeat-containing domain protein [Mycena capillaripes]|nr:WD40-repeat-containing domain protein [Mycena capillaripes]
MVFSPDSKYVVSGSCDKTVRIWDMMSKNVFRILSGHTDAIESVTFLSDGRHIVSGSFDKTLRVWDIEKRDLSRLPLSLHSSSPHLLDWEITKGWVSSYPSELLFWLPPNLRIGLWLPNTKLVISKQQTSLSYDNFVHGREWRKCYVPIPNI